MPGERRILLTGFEPWADRAVNPAQRLAERLDGWRHADARVVSLILPVAHRAAREIVAAAMRDLRPAAVLHLGLAFGRPALTVERWAHNRADFAAPDTAGDQPRDQPVRDVGPSRYATSLDAALAVAAVRAAGVPAATSDHAGAFVCNVVLYASLDAAAGQGSASPVGFVHLPAPETLALGDQERAVERVLRVLAGLPS